MVIGAVWGLLGVLALGGGVFIRQLVDQYAPGSSDPNAVNRLGDAVGGALAVLGIVILVFAVVEVLGGFGALLGKGWGRFLGILYSLVFGVGLLLIISSGLRASDTSVDVDSGVRVFFIVILAMFLMYLYSLVVLLVRWRGHARA